MHTNTHTRAHSHTHTHTHAHTRAHTHTHTHARTYKRTHAHTHTCLLFLFLCMFVIEQCWCCVSSDLELCHHRIDQSNLQGTVRLHLPKPQLSHRSLDFLSSWTGTTSHLFIGSLLLVYIVCQGRDLSEYRGNSSPLT